MRGTIIQAGLEFWPAIMVDASLTNSSYYEVRDVCGSEVMVRPVSQMGGALCLWLLALAGTVPSSAQTVDTLEIQQTEREEEFRRVSEELALSEKRQEEIAAEIAAIKDDSATLTAALIQAVKTERKLGEDIDEIKHRLDDLSLQEDEIKQSLAARRGTLAEVLAALQRMGLNPPPAILVRPEDALASVRSAILLGAVVPELRSETELLIADLEELGQVKTSIAAEKGRLDERRMQQVEEKERLRLLLQEKQRVQAMAEARMADEREQAEQLAERAGSLKELIGRLESEIQVLREFMEARRTADGEESLLTETLPFSRRAGLVPLPVVGEFASRFGDEDGMGSALKGDILRTQSGAIVTAPAAGMVLYAGPFRSYGQLLILNPGGGYHIVLAGMDRLNVSLGQTVLAGEPVGVMGEARLASIAASTTGSMPELYVEFRKDGKPIDPRRWWAREISGRTGNGT